MWDISEKDSLWRFVGGNYSINTGILENIRYVNIQEATHYKFDLKILPVKELKDKNKYLVIKNMISCPYLEMRESEHRVIFNGSKVTVIHKIVPKIIYKNRAVEKVNVAMKIMKARKKLITYVENLSDS